MADEELELDVNESKGSKKTIIMVVIGILLLNGIGVGAWFFLSGGDSSSNTTKKEKVVLGPLIYFTLVPEFIINFGPKSKVRYLQVDLQISTRQKSSLDIISTYRPVLRNDILVLLSDVSYEELKDRAGKVALQKRLLKVINKVVVAAQADPDDSDSGQDDGAVKGPIENVYFTHFIMQ